MRLVNFIKCIVGVTILSLVYIHMHMKIIQMAYNGKEKEDVVRSLIEENGHLTYKILTLKSSNNLGIKLLSGDSDMGFVDPQNIIQVSSPEDAFEESLASQKEISSDKANNLFRLISFGTQAEAKTK